MATKNPTEISGMRRAHIRDAVALCKFFSNLESRFNKGERFDEHKAVTEVQRIRREQQFFVTESYPDIIGYGPNGAVIHYHPTTAVSSALHNESTIVIDTGAQYYDGTIDMTRTIHLGNPTDQHREAYTRVLIGSIQLSTFIFPDNVNTSLIDVMARAPLWEIGYDYPHGTGHGIGAFRNVHESPVDVRYKSRKYVKPQLLEPGYFLSGEPGFYIGGQFGIRLENILQVIEMSHLKKPNGHRFLGFETITLVPYSPKLINYTLLDRRHRQWLNKYNTRIRTVVGAELLKQNETEAYLWMLKNTEYIPDNVNNYE
ncbi:hypothetical protein ILUMI_11644 [Ignelater luminosus]|uniref:Xaa-Pro aminopeptidase n=1 Tax=Ignelater luminosus TaxID=2038154 RepID=A0A8K0CZQ4_IGNLU|nr:hypothetical protein ILUMI_11644 [Ignelater luminosus]